ncbi:asparagine synthase (glutamine-hydrolyzing) [Vibrio lentus]|uniref:asparagine synthase (glutamine-hydrolyzing) n=1 Tax=Vibrio lentus TaxID=136468 RepID=UPI000C84A404|nr:asparagine synthase (glutamine-hydrolyzing) [Vibrio lentus]PMI85449.1 asparagine synthase (glutamine-hydrolyzing) [Vibrio lentus]
MCGIAGILTFGDSTENLECSIKNASNAQIHRGPDIQDYSIYKTNNYALALAHQRLSIIDLSDSGRQPMETESSSLIFNGEIYNYKEIKSNLPKNLEFRSKTDTEVMLHALETYGIEKAVNMFNGMWAFAWYNKSNKKIYLCRDRMGIKPLYYHNEEGTLTFASEVKAIQSSSAKKYKLNHQAIGEYLKQSLQDTFNNSFFEEINQIPAGCFGEIDLSNDTVDIKIVRYWNPDLSQTNSQEDLETEFKDLFYDSVNLRLRADVPVGVTLSGGLDSSAIASAMKSILPDSSNLNCLSAVSPGSQHDESEFIDIMQTFLDTKVRKVTLDWEASEAMDLLREITVFNDSPAGSFSNVAHYLLMKEAKENNITVILSGQGADEILCGYKKFVGFYFLSLFRRNKLFTLTSEIINFVAKKTILTQFKLTEAKRYIPFIREDKKFNIFTDKLNNLYCAKPVGINKTQSLSERQFEDVSKYSVPYLTHYEDRMSMAWAREVRLPFLDYRIVEFCLRLPEQMKIRNGWTKYILRTALKDALPKKITWRKDKQGFVNPQEEWLRHELKSDVISTFSSNALIFKMDLIDRDSLLAMYDDYCNNDKTKVWYRDIFAPLALEVWLQANKEFISNE